MKTSVDKNSEANFVFRNVFEFMNAWESGKDSKLILESRNGKAWVNFSCYLGAPQDKHVKTKRRKSSRQMERDNMRAKLHQLKLNHGNDKPEEADPASAEDNDVVENAASAVPVSESVVVSDSENFVGVKTESLHAIMYIHSEEPKIDNCYIHQKPIVMELVNEVARKDTEVEEIVMECENKKIRGKYVGFKRDEAPFKEGPIETFSGKPFIFKVKVKVKYRQNFDKCRSDKSFKPLADAFREEYMKKGWVSDWDPFSPGQVVYINWSDGSRVK